MHRTQPGTATGAGTVNEAAKDTGAAKDIADANDAANDTDAATDVEALQATCTRYLVGHGRRTAADFLADIDGDTTLDRYGAGGVVAELEGEVAAVLGKPAAVFLPTGVMAQQSTLRVLADRSGRRTIVAHPATHLDWHEGRGYERLHGLSLRQAGELRRPLELSDLEELAETPAALLIELPQRDLGGVQPSWEDLAAQVEWAHRRQAMAHLDGARLWESAAGYGRSPAEVAAFFDTVYVSFYKGLGSIGGCCVAGPADVVAEVREWRRRHGGTVIGLWPYAASSLTSLRKRLPRMEAYHRHGQAIADVLRTIPGVEVVPDPPHTPHFHVHLHRHRAAVREAALRLARDRGVWTFSGWWLADTPSVQRVELPVGDATMGFSPEEVGEIFQYLLGDEAEGS